MQKSCGSWQIYITLRRKNLIISFALENLKNCTKSEKICLTIKRNTISNDTLTTLFHDVRSFSKHADDSVSDDKTVIDNDITGFTELEINP